MDRSSTHRRPDAAGLLIALILFVITGLIWWDMTTLQISSVYGPGPKAMPIVVASGLLLLAIANAIIAFRGGLPERESLDWKPILLILGGLAALVALIAHGGGFILGTTILFAATAAAFGRRAFLTDLVIGFVLAILIFVVFAKLLALSLPMGPIENLF
ncbi:tripartite tricarboxylate transporter TctB family protein [Microvirga roseola]|uniref:tripartite tricarboxylate transporter TctB family protein n=1 Tax=Microvirga roseola TaxID=2883126 RepID=UPI001E44027C|nr:tripartite tricarboxylate transporter TctB family protein [Microvirga roseola]